MTAKHTDRIAAELTAERDELNDALRYDRIAQRDYDSEFDSLNAFAVIARDTGATIAQVREVAASLARDNFRNLSPDEQYDRGYITLDEYDELTRPADVNMTKLVERVERVEAADRDLAYRLMLYVYSGSAGEVFCVWFDRDLARTPGDLGFDESVDRLMQVDALFKGAYNHIRATEILRDARQLAAERDDSDLLLEAEANERALDETVGARDARLADEAAAIADDVDDVDRIAELDRRFADYNPA